MGTLQRINRWSAVNHPWWLIVFRVALGLTLLFKGILFIRDSVLLQNLISSSVFPDYPEWLILVITWLHLLGGTFIVIGLFTRTTTLLLIPVIAFAVIFINWSGGNLQELLFSIVALLMLIFFFFEGGGPISVDNYIAKKMGRPSKL
ncbi:MAG: DoxX family membrane protein [Chitinophagaceae bacterium]|nr:DoxX family membrane protein [Chitinophagaceae bacterium]MCW5925785.1 DoxX family membrane protein [Chitinophagaceae bacterium]